MATKPTTLQDVFDKNQYDLKTAVRKSRAWFDQEAAKMTRQGITPPSVLRGRRAEETAMTKMKVKAC